MFFSDKNFGKMTSSLKGIFVSNEKILVAASLLRFEKINLINQFVNKGILSLS